jgi:pimeloyl-ACP methyl ester carboxylesterase
MVSEVQRADVGAVQIAYETQGPPDGPPVLLVSGLGGQLISWDDGFCRRLTDRGLRVIRFDNRDVGLSTHLGDRPSDLEAALRGDADAIPYRLVDLADDAAGLVEHLGLDSAHVVGVSMGGMIAQQLAISHPDRVRSLTSIMSTTGHEDVGQPTEAAMAVLLAPPSANRDEYLERGVWSGSVLGSPAYPTDPEVLRERAGRGYDRAYDPPGVVRQLTAVLTTPDRTDELRRLSVPTVVIHGKDDPLVTVSGGEATAAAVPGAQLVLVDGMGHDLPEVLWPLVVDHIADLVQRAEASRSADAATPPSTAAAG